MLYADGVLFLRKVIFTYEDCVLRAWLYCFVDSQSWLLRLRAENLENWVHVLHKHVLRANAAELTTLGSRRGWQPTAFCFVTSSCLLKSCVFDHSVISFTDWRLLILLDQFRDVLCHQRCCDCSMAVLALNFLALFMLKIVRLVLSAFPRRTHLSILNSVLALIFQCLVK